MSVVIPFPVSDPACGTVGGPVPRGGVGDAPPVFLSAAVAPARRRHRRLIAAAGRWALARGRPLVADHVALWAAVAELTGRFSAADAPTGPWYASELGGFLQSAVTGWCSAAGCPVPTDLSGSFQSLYGFLADTGRLQPASDPLPALCAALAVAAPLHRSPAPLPTPPAA